MLTLVLVVILAALVFEFINGFHDTANSIATVVATKVLSPGWAVMLAAFMNLIGALTGTAVALTIASGLLNTNVVEVTPQVILCALLGGIIWNLITWWFGLPSSSSHALIGGLIGAVFVFSGTLLVPRLGAAGLICLIVFGQVVGSLLVDHFGVLSQPRPVDLLRLAGATLVCVGALLVVRPWQPG